MAPLSTSRFHGRNGKLFVGLANGTAAPQPVAYIDTFEVDTAVEFADATAFGDSNKTSLAGLPDDKGAFTGYSDIAGDALYAASRDGVARRFYFYPDYVNAVGTYYHGSAFFSMKTNFSVSDASKVSGEWRASSDINRVLTA